MLKINLFIEKKAKEEWLKEALALYQKRMTSRALFSWHLVDMKAPLPVFPKTPLIVLDLKGKFLSSEELSHKLFSTWGARVSFAIGGAEGIPSLWKEQADFLWSLSPLTFTHQMVQLLLLEQIYRAIEIEKNSNYHK